MEEVLNITELKKKIESFANDRDWRKFHTPKNLTMALTVESAELMEIFQWLTVEESEEVMKNPELREEILDEVADVMVYLVRLSDLMGINLPDAIDRKIKKNAAKYPVEKAKGVSTKYNKL